jgi:antitoxin HicB
MSEPLTYPARFERGEEGELIVTFRDLPEANTFGWSEEEAYADAADALSEALASRIRDDENVPAASSIEEGEHAIVAPVEIAAKIAVYQAFRASKLSQSELARRLDVGENEVRRILDPGHRTKLDRLERAARALGVRFQLIAVPV